MTIYNTWFKKDKKKLISYTTGYNDGTDGKAVNTTVDYILIRQRDRHMLKDAKMICGEECVVAANVEQHQLLVVDLMLKYKERRKVKFVPKLKVWLLKEAKYRERFAAEVKDDVGLVREVASVNDKWGVMRDRWKSAAEKVVGWTKGKPRHRETWWWNARVGEAVDRKKIAYKNWYEDKSAENLETHKSAKKEARREVAVAKANKGKEIIDNWKLDENPVHVFKVAKKLMRERQDIEGVKCLRNGSGRIVTSEEDIKETWKEYMEKVMNEEFVWEKNLQSSKKKGPASRITEAEVCIALKV